MAVGFLQKKIKNSDQNYFALNFVFESNLRNSFSFQGLYAETLMTREEFIEMFDESHYLKVRKSIPMCEEAFPEVYDKISKLGRK